MLKLSYGTCEDTLFLDPSLELTLSRHFYESVRIKLEIPRKHCRFMNDKNVTRLYSKYRTKQ